MEDGSALATSEPMIAGDPRDHSPALRSGSQLAGVARMSMGLTRSLQSVRPPEPPRRGDRLSPEDVARWIPVFVITAQAMRAILLATGTAATFASLRANNCVSHGYLSGWARACSRQQMCQRPGVRPLRRAGRLYGLRVCPDPHYTIVPTSLAMCRTVSVGPAIEELDSPSTPTWTL